jgi:riboflavin kinase/FMN adenylyltransferase
VDDVLVVPFSREIADWTPERFVEDILAGTLHAAAVVVGTNFRFGKRAAGDVALLTQRGAELGFRAEGIPLDGGPQVWSSTYVRTCLAAGDVEGAAEALGRPVAIRGVVQEGDRRGRDLGYPTANVAAWATALPADGVYAGWLEVLSDGHQEPQPAAISVGVNPTFAGERERRAEAYVLDRDDLDLYGKEVQIAFVRRLRPMHRFDSVDALLEAMGRDVEETREALGV